ncbi:MAG: hypothetical protein DIU71_02215 [Proteobacteria bacterium]|nr:MAG: hypothetical protein DIU71_02215 [Pseudomonadota bacterium]
MSRRTARRACVATILLCCLPGCSSPVREEPRPSRSTLGCVQETLRQKLPPGLSDVEAHCVAAGLIARHCSAPEAMLASIGKEIGDLFGAGHAQWRDLRADWQGMRCARQAGDGPTLLECCVAGPARPGR